jgi:molybdopterin-guanine dinucleotide biosynthesis protein A
MALWQHKIELDAPPADTFARLIQTRNRIDWSPPDWHLSLVEGPARLAAGCRLRWKTRRRGLSQQMTTEITAFDPPWRIVEEQRQGPLTRWVHTSTLTSLPAGQSQLVETIEFEPPGGLLGLAMKADDIIADLEAAYALRDARLRAALERRLRTGGIVLCGGRSRRMGRPKAWLPFGEEPLLARVARLLGAATWPLVVVAAPNQELPALPADVAVVRDAVVDRGPLQGLAAGLIALAGRAEAAYISSCDAPFLQPLWVARLAELLGEHQICVPRVGEYHHPLAALYRLGVLDAVEALLRTDRLRPVFLFDAVPTRIAEAADLVDVDPDFGTLRNLNTPEDYAQALRDAGFSTV